jgi:hypothetical protein
MSREALISLTAAAKSMNLASEQISGEVAKLTQTANGLSSIKAISDKVNEANQLIESLSAGFQNKIHSSRSVIVVLLSSLSAMAILISFLFARTFTKPLHEAIRIIGKIAQGGPMTT